MRKCYLKKCKNKFNHERYTKTKVFLFGVASITNYFCSKKHMDDWPVNWDPQINDFLNTKGK